MVPFELMITCTGLWLTCFVILFLYALLKFSTAAFEWLAFIAFENCYVQFCASRKKSAGLWLSHCFFVDSNNDIFPLRFLSSLLKAILIVMKLCFLINNMHWALIDLFLWYYFCIHDYSFTRGCFFVACYYCFRKVICSFVPQGNALLWVWFFGDLKIFFLLLSLFCFLIDCDGDETVIFELNIRCTGLWLTCFVILFLYTRLLSFPRLLPTGLLLLLSKFKCNFVPQGNASLWLSLFFGDLRI